MTQKFESLVASVTCALAIGLVGCSSAPTAPAPSGGTPPGTVVADGGTSSTGTPASGSDAGGTTVGGACQVDTGSKPCDACLQQNCCAQFNACDSDTDCVALDTCLQKCPDPNTQAGQQCGDTCYQQHPQGATKADAIDECAAKSCQTACQ